MSLQAQVSFRQEEGRTDWRDGGEGGGAGRGKKEKEEGHGVQKESLSGKEERHGDVEKSLRCACGYTGFSVRPEA